MSERGMNERDVARFWDDLVSGRAAAGSQPLDAHVSDQIHAFQTAAATPPPEASRQQVTRDVREAIEKLAREQPGQESSVDRARLNGLESAREPRAQRHGFPGDDARRWSTAQLAIAAVLLLVGLGIGYVVFGPGFGGDEARTTIPAVVEPAAIPTPETVWEEISAELTLPAEALPPGVAGSFLAHFTLRPGARTTWTVFQNAMLNAVLEGTLVVRSGGPVQVLRAAGDGEWETVPGPAEVSLGPGDIVLLLNVTTVDFDNPGDVPLEILQWGLASGSRTEPPMPPEWWTNDYAMSSAGAPSLPGNTGLLSLPGREGMLRLETIVLEPNSSLPPAPADVLRMAIAVPTDNAAGTPVVPIVARRSDGSIEAFGAQATTLYVITLAIAGGAGTPIVQP